MKVLKSIFALVLCLALSVTCLVGCHEKGEIAVTIGDIEFTAGYYACVLVQSDDAARTKVEEALSKDSSLSGEIDYYSQKIENKDYETWVRENALNTLKDIAAVKTLCKKANFDLDDEAKSLADSEADYYWYSYGLSAIYEPNGVSEQTYREYTYDKYLINEYFEFVYGKGGEKEIAADKISKQLTDNYALVNKLEVSFTDLKDDAKADKKELFAKFEKELKEGTKTFEKVYLEYNEIKEEDHKHEEAEEGETLPQDQHATILGKDEESYYYSKHFETASKMTVGEVKVITLEEDAGLVLLVKKDISADPYYLETLDLMLRDELEGENHSKAMTEYGKSLDCVVNDFSIEQFEIEEIYYPEVTY